MTDDLKFAGNLPVVIQKNGEVNEPFAPVRSSSCNIGVVSRHLLTDLYSSDKQEIKVKVEKVNKTDSTTTNLFEGYLTPNTYSQTLSPNLDNIDMTAIDPVSMLKYLYIDDILEKSKTISMGELIARALAAVKIDIDELWIEDNLKYDGTKTLVDMLVQTNNFWDEGGDGMTMYAAVGECLRLFGYTLVFTGDKYMIYSVMTDHTFGTTYRDFIRYRIYDGGVLSGAIGRPQIKKSNFHFIHSEGDWTTIDDSPSLSIDNTYDRISGVASTKIPNYSFTAFDMISSEERDKYDVGDLNIAKNKIKGYNSSGELVSDDEWFYIWNGVYINPDFGLDIEGGNVNGYANINGAYEYMTGQTGHPTASGGILNFYGTDDNPVGTGRDPEQERVVEVKECITVFAPDNGLAPEFLEKDDLKWDFTGGYSDGDGENSYDVESTCVKQNSSDAKYGVNCDGVEDAVSYSQKYENITISKDAEQTLVIDLSQSYSRTGINQNITISNYSDITNKTFTIVNDGDGENTGNTFAKLRSGTAYTYPWTWQCDNVTVDYGYFSKYSFSGSTSDAPLKEVWDKRKVILFVQLMDGTKYQFNGKDWVETEYITDTNAFYLWKLMNYGKIFGEEFRYDIIQCGDGNRFSLNEDGFIYYTDSKGGVYKSGESGTKHTIKYYGAPGNDWLKYVDDISEGTLSIILPAVDAVNATVQCDIYHSSLLGTTGNSSHGAPGNTYHIIRYKVTQSGADNSGEVAGEAVEIYWAPINATYIKAEHLNIDISLSVPESNLGQMFGESDIKYQTAPSKKFRESFDTPSFLVNTKHPIVSQSHSYVIVGNSLADPNKFSIGWQSSKIACRPENYVMQGYKNYWGTIRKSYTRVLVPHKAGFSNCLCYIEAPDIPDDGNGRWLMVLSDQHDVKTNRHTITAIEDYGLTVKEIQNYTVIELPRKSRNPRFDLPSVQKHK